MSRFWQKIHLTGRQCKCSCGSHIVTSNPSATDGKAPHPCNGSLVIEKAYQVHQGIYTCHARNLIALRTINITVRVIFLGSCSDIRQAGFSVRGGPFDFWWGGCANPKRNIEHVLLVKKKYHAEFLRRKKISGSRNQGVGKDFCVIRDGPKSSCESHDTGLGITFFDVWFGILKAHGTWSTNYISY